MKAEDAQRLWEGTDGARPWLELHPSDRVYFVEFARACEQHGVERTVAALQATVADSYTDHLVRLTRERVADDRLVRARRRGREGE